MTFDESLLSPKPKKTFEFPDGYNHAFGLERYKVPETLFQPHIFDQEEKAGKAEDDKMGEDKSTAEASSEKKEEEKKTNYLGVHEMVYNSINNCDIDLRPLLFNNVVVTGGNTLFNGFNERLNYELPIKSPGVSHLVYFFLLCV